MENRIMFSLLALALVSGFAFAISSPAAAPSIPAPDRWNGEVAAASAASSTQGSGGWALLQPANLPPSFYGYLEATGNSGQESPVAFADNVYYFSAKLL